MTQSESQRERWGQLFKAFFKFFMACETIITANFM